jgi:hypothetical protein
VEPAAYVFFEGEPIALRLIIVNTKVETAAFVTRSPDPAHVFSASATRDGNPLPVQVEFSTTLLKRFSWGQDVVQHAVSHQLQQTEGLEWKATVLNRLLPGIYRVEFEVHANDGASRPIRRTAPGISFEVRSRSSDTLPEILLRQAYRHYSREEFTDASDTVTELLNAHPTSYQAYLLKARIAGALGNVAEARQATREAREIVRTDRDPLFLKHRPGAKDEVLRGLTDQLNR